MSRQMIHKFFQFPFFLYLLSQLFMQIIRFTTLELLCFIMNISNSVSKNGSLALLWAKVQASTTHVIIAIKKTIKFINLYSFHHLIYFELSKIYITPMLRDTNKPSSAKRNLKLPKLSIQQQIDNQQVIERMNRKITFTKNPRHLNSSIPFSQGLTKQPTETNFTANPSQLFFNHFQANHIYEAQVQLINHSKLIQRIKIAPLANKQFVISQIKYPNQNSGDIAPGLHVSVFIRFRPVSLHDCQDQLVVIVGNGVMKIPIQARKQKWEVSWPKLVQVGHCWVGDSIRKTFKVKNSGGSAKFQIKAESENQTVHKGYFKISPKNLIIQKGKQGTFAIDFTPQKSGTYSQVINIQSDQGEQKEIAITLSGGGYTAHLQIQAINKKKVREQNIHNHVYLNNCQIGVPCKAEISIRNKAVVNVDYFWHSQHSSLEISNKQGKMDPSALIPFNITYTASNREPQQITATLYLFNLPQQSLLTNSVTKDINGKKAIECLVFHFQARQQQSVLIVSPLHQRIGQNIYPKIPVQTKILIKNESSTKREFKITPIKIHQYCSVQISNSAGTVGAHEEISISISYSITQLSKNLCQCYYLVEFDNAPSQIFSIEGIVTYPQLQIEDDQVYFGIARTFTSLMKSVKIENKQSVPLKFKFNNPHKYYDLDFYDLYEFQSEEFYEKKLIITSSLPLDLEGWFQIKPHSQSCVQFNLHTMNEDLIDLDVQFEVQHGQITPIKIKAFVQNVSMAISNQRIHLKQIYKGNIYNSNKFLKREIAIVNNNNIDAEYAIKFQPNELCNIQISPLQGFIKKKSKRRIDLILEPQKAGILKCEFEIEYYDTVKINEEGGQILQQEKPTKKKLVGKQKIVLQSVIKGVEIAYFIKDQSRAKRVRQKFNEDGATSVKLSSYSAKSNKTLYENDKIVYPNLQDLKFYNCEINQVKQLQIIIANQSGLTAEYEIYAQNYRTLQKVQSSRKSKVKGLIGGNQQAFTSQMGQTFVKNRALDRSQKVHLSNNKGISIMCEPSQGVLHKKQSQKIVITLFNDTSGRFIDNLIIDVKDQEKKKFPIDIHIRGTPVSLSKNQLGINFNTETPMMNLGSILTKNGQIRKNIKVVNNGPKAVQLNWDIYPYNITNSSTDLFNISFQEPFPGSDNIIQLKWQANKPQIDNDSPFSIEPKVKVLQGRQQFSFALTIKQISKQGIFENLVIGNAKMVQTKTLMQSLAVIIRSQCIKPHLQMDRKHTNHINKFELFAIPPLNQQTNANNHFRKIKLKNPFTTNISLTLAIQTCNSQKQSFTIVSTSTNSQIATFQPRISQTQFQKSFILAHQNFIQIGIEIKGNPKNLNDWPMQPKVRKNGKLILQYSNGDKQQIDLVGWLYRPWIEVEMPNHLPFNEQNFGIEFGQVYTKNTKKESIFIKNCSKCIAKWNISYIKYHQSIKYKFEQALWTDQDKQDQTIKDEKKCFMLSKFQGTLLSESIPLHYMPGTLALTSNDDKYARQHKPDKIDFLFKPEINCLYKSKFRISVQQGPTFDIVVRGRGTYDEQYEKR